MNSSERGMVNRKLSPSEQGFDIVVQSLAGMPVTRKEVRQRIARLLSNGFGGTGLLESLKSLEQDLLRRAYKTQIENITRRLEESMVVPYREIRARKSSKDADQTEEVLITPSHQARMEAYLRHLKLLLDNKPLKDSRTRRREK